MVRVGGDGLQTAVGDHAILGRCELAPAPEVSGRLPVDGVPRHENTAMMRVIGWRKFHQVFTRRRLDRIQAAHAVGRQGGVWRPLVHVAEYGLAPRRLEHHSKCVGHECVSASRIHSDGTLAQADRNVTDNRIVSVCVKKWRIDRLLIAMVTTALVFMILPQCGSWDRSSAVGTRRRRTRPRQLPRSIQATQRRAPPHQVTQIA